MGYLEEKVEAKNGDANCHSKSRNKQQKFAAEFVHDECGWKCRQRLDGADNDAVEPGFKRRARLHENVIGEEKNGVDSRHLLQKHDTEKYQQSLHSDFITKNSNEGHLRKLAC